MAIVQGLDIRDSSGNQLDVVTHHYNGEWVQTVNAADMLSVTIPSEYCDSVVNGNEIWLRRGDENEIVRKFVIMITEAHKGNREETLVTAYDYSALLLKVPVSEYPTEEPESGLISVSDYLDYLMSLAALQGFTWGVLPLIPSAYNTVAYNDLHLKDSNVLAGLHAVRNVIGGMLWVDNDKILNWYDERYQGYSGTFNLELDRNCIDVAVKTDDTTNETRTTYSVDVVDLSAHDVTDDGMLNIGMPVTIDLPDGTTQELYITDIRQQIDNPLALQIAVNTTLDTTGRFRDVLDYIIDSADPGNFIDSTIDNFETSIDEFKDWLSDTDYTNETFQDSLASELAYSETITTVGTTGETVGVADTVMRGDHKHQLDETELTTFIEDVLDEDGGGLPTTIDEDLSVIPLLYKAKVASLNADGNQIAVYMYDYVADAYEGSTKNIYKPPFLQYSEWTGTVTYTDGTSVTYDVTDLDKKYQRRATWEDEEEVEQTEVQEITSPYAVNEVLYVIQDRAGNLIDANYAGRHWAVNEDEA
jgi:hypothetical protein